jgi:hypothetical protein
MGFQSRGIQALLDTPKLNACQSPGVPWKGAHIATRGTEPLKRLIEHESIYEYSYEQSSQDGPAA